MSYPEYRKATLQQSQRGFWQYPSAASGFGIDFCEPTTNPAAVA
jgi:hypothetical protein